MDKEIHLLQDVMGCWEVMNISDLPSDANLIGRKWVYQVKFRENVYDKHRARIVALGYQQRQGVDYFQSLSPTASQISIRLVMALTRASLQVFSASWCPVQLCTHLSWTPHERSHEKSLHLRNWLYNLHTTRSTRCPPAIASTCCP
jgi:hypothetical protein